MSVQTLSITSFREAAEHALHATRAGTIEDAHAHVLVFDAVPWRLHQEAALHLLSPLEQQRAGRFRLAEHRDTYVLAHAFWRLAIAMALARDVRSVGLVISASGQPQLPGIGYATSLSHSGTHIAIALARAACVGVDIEQAPPRQGLYSLVSVLCTPHEARAIEALAEDERDAALLALWTRKEALLKAFGIGLREAPTGIAADPGRLIAPPLSAVDAYACLIHPLALPTGLTGALAAPAAIQHVVVHRLPTPSDRLPPDTA
ncbi:4'-phosphopantetheinyl transferase superfamily protein [Dyella sp. ASV21]|uniref:4'-phosphopantetheinyl transferase family protein n=1 Tax=Dyella sp. ASV21 TaxID=2795114 RepID=UPI0018EB5B13|nr:4'-phosphopantetheinyl transferase superfamily protein [Dyella sp. ASV21]